MGRLPGGWRVSRLKAIFEGAVRVIVRGVDEDVLTDLATSCVSAPMMCANFVASAVIFFSVKPVQLG